MRKILLGTTAVVGLALAAPAAFAQSSSLIGQGPAGAAPPAVQTSGLSVRLGGYFQFGAATISDSMDTGATRQNMTNGGTSYAAGTTARQARQSTDFRNDAEINIYVDGSAANGLQYGAVLELQMDTNATTAGTGTTVDYDEMYGFVKGAWGELRFGQEDSAASLMQVRRPTVLGVDDDWDEYLVSSYIFAGVNDGNDSTKIIYLSPQFSGVDFGVSYSPNRNEGEQAVTSTSSTAWQRDFTGLTNEVSAAIRYRGTLGAVGITAGAVAQFADAPKLSATGETLATKAQNLAVYSVGLNLAAYGFTVGGEYTWGTYSGIPGGTALNTRLDNSSHYGLGATYTTGPIQFGAVYMRATQDNGGTVEDRTQDYMGVGMAYTLAPGMFLYASYNKMTDNNVPVAAATSAGAALVSYDNGSKTRTAEVALSGVRLAF